MTVINVNIMINIFLLCTGGYGLGHGELIDGIIKDGLWDVYDNIHMGNCAEQCAKQYNIDRKQQDDYAISSYQRAQQATKQGLFKNEIVPVTIKDKKKGEIIIDFDDEPLKLNVDKIPNLRAAFQKDGTVTAANSSKINDGAACVIVCSGAYARQHGLKPLAKIRGYADAQKSPVEFTTAPAIAIPKSLERAGVAAKDVDLYEINEAFSVVALANAKILNLDVSKVNVWGGAVALGLYISLDSTAC
jgi:acetyl-CoA C-acetyltransferase